MNFSGRIISKAVKEGTTKSGEAYKAVSYVVREEGQQYPQTAVMEVFSKTSNPKPELEVGDFASFDFAMDAQEYQGRWYGKNNAWKVGKSLTTPNEAPKSPTDNPGVNTTTTNVPQADNLPF
ncbi:hypothetical protein PF672P2_00078 [Parabacteroides phage PF672P2]|nr:hypothetical protein PF672P1_00034 [Parabacteroides phage PF672P1]WAX17215.1 hypothetical protein PF672P2_00078 [Parabacteroides phage PF672P2]